MSEWTYEEQRPTFEEYAALQNKASARGKRIKSQVLEWYDNLWRSQVGRFCIHRIVKRQRGRALDDMNQTAIEGLLYALDKFDPDFGGPFGGHAKTWIWFFLDRHYDRDADVFQRRHTGMPASLRVKVASLRAQGIYPTGEDLGVSQKQLDRWNMPPRCISLEYIELETHDDEVRIRHPLRRFLRAVTTNQDETPEDSTAVKQEVERVRDAVAALPAPMGELVQRTLLGEESVTEVSQELRINPAKAFKLIRTAKALLKELLEIEAEE